jgi:hypothetical protein
MAMRYIQTKNDDRGDINGMDVVLEKAEISTQIGDVIRLLKHRPLYAQLPPDRVCSGKLCRNRFGDYDDFADSSIGQTTLAQLFSLFIPEDELHHKSSIVHRLWIVDAPTTNNNIPAMMEEDGEDFFEVQITTTKTMPLSQKVSVQQLQSVWQHQSLIGVVSMTDVIRTSWLILMGKV